jgi:hypothetical protein
MIVHSATGENGKYALLMNGAPMLCETLHDSDVGVGATKARAFARML